jgi:hypothetical protein
MYSVAAPHTVLSFARLRGLYKGLEEITRSEIPGDIVECGIASGGSLLFMGLLLKRLNATRALWGFDTFEGLPAPTANDPDYEVAKRFTGKYRGDRDEVRLLLNVHNVETHLVPGLFQKTLPNCPVDRIAFLHIDGDWYDSVRTCLDCLYDKLSPGGIIQFDDYGHWAGSRKAVDEFFERRHVNPKLLYLDYTGRQFRTPRS